MQASEDESETSPMGRVDGVRPLPTGERFHRLLASFVSPIACGTVPETEWHWSYIYMTIEGVAMQYLP